MGEQDTADGWPAVPEWFRPSAEFQLLTACSWLSPPRFEPLQHDHITALCSRPVDWDVFLSLVKYHGVQPLAYVALLRHTHIPDRVQKTLKSWKVQVSARSLQYSAELVHLVALLAAHGIDVIPLKGVALSLKLYGEPGARNSSDLDILVKPEHVDAVSQLLEAEGYQSGLHGVVLSAKQKRYIRDNLYHAEFVHAEKGVTVELHWKPGSLWLPVHVEMLWYTVTHLPWMNTRFTCLDDDALLLFLCDHGSRHRYYSLKWLGDIARLISCDRPQGWAGLIELAERLDLRRTLGHSVLLIHWLYGIPLTEDMRVLISTDRYVVTVSRKVLDLLVKSASIRAPFGKRLGGIMLAWQVLRLRSSLPVVRTVRPSLIAAVDFSDFPLPDRLFWLYYPLRPVLWLWRYFIKK